MSPGPHFPSIHWMFWKHGRALGYGGPATSVWPHADLQSFFGWGRRMPTQCHREDLSVVSPLRVLCTLTAGGESFLDPLRPFCGSLGASGLLMRQPGAWSQPHSQLPGVPGHCPWASEQTAGSLRNTFSSPPPPSPYLSFKAHTATLSRSGPLHQGRALAPPLVLPQTTIAAGVCDCPCEGRNQLCPLHYPTSGH